MPKVETFDREEILGKVIQLFHRKGYNATSMQDLVDATGLNRSSIYNSFGSKMELYQESLKVYKQMAEKAIQKYLINSDTPIETIRSIFSLNPKYTNNGCMLSNCTTEMANKDQKIKSFLIHNREGMEELFESLVAKGQNEGSINTNRTAKEYALYLFTSLQGFRITGIIIDEQKDLESIVNTILSVLE
ncbi:TetR/AcrR family transcriptional regulator [Pseudotenacibaculum haliotis]|uniref:TetR/AcrR family transcriptional regulator n=1 Tax=Pseudotenacibaculum haliotis TaxID=1862138 RepID=A0ABW5LUI1_9FLAO